MKKDLRCTTHKSPTKAAKNGWNKFIMSGIFSYCNYSRMIRKYEFLECSSCVFRVLTLSSKFVGYSSRFNFSSFQKIWNHVFGIDTLDGHKRKHRSTYSEGELSASAN